MKGMKSSFPYLGVYTHVKASRVFIYNHFSNVYVNCEGIVGIFLYKIIFLKYWLIADLIFIRF